MKRSTIWIVVAIAIAQLAPAFGQVPSPSPSVAIVASITDPALAEVLRDVLDRNPDIAAAAAAVEADRLMAPQARALPQPEAQVTGYLMPPETRVGALRAMAMVSQRLPGGGKRALSEQAAGQQATASAAELEALRLQRVTEARTLYHEIGFLDAALAVLETDRATLAHFEEVARARYASGVGLQQEVVSIQAEITRLDARRSDLQGRRATSLAALNSLRDRFASPLAPNPSPKRATPTLDWSGLRERAMSARPELAALDARVDRAATEAEIAGKRGAPDFSVGVVYGFVEPRTDANPPGNGDDDLGLTGGITIPIWRDGIRAGVEEATGRRLAAEQQRRAAVVGIDRELEALRGRLPEIGRQVELFEGTLRIQSEQALRSAEAAYASGGVDALALLDSERTLLDVRLAAVRSRVDLAIALGELERTIAGPLTATPVLSSDAAGGTSPSAQRVGEPPPRLEARTSEPRARDLEPATRNPQPGTRGGASS